MEVSITVGGEEVTYMIEEELYFDLDNISEALETHSGQLTWWSSLLARKEKELSNAKVLFDSAFGKASIYIRTSPLYLEKYGKKLTEGVISAELDSDAELVSLRMDLNELKLQVGYLKAMVEGMRSRTTLLATSGSIRRSEFEAGMRSVVKRARKGHEEEVEGE